ncbi:MAG: hypothetical protein HRT36_05150, partial [Alphaproteobacteria bacterium]|nr:hypothetical protein [Alphaproteobacteria bacterium]
GQLPSRSAVRERYEWQLPILALMAREGSFDGVPSGGRAAQLAYWRIGGSKGDRIWNLTRGEDQDDDFKELLNTVAVTFSARLRALGDRETPFSALPDPDQLPSHTNYAHLIRGEEWLDIVFDGIDGDDT